MKLATGLVMSAGAAFGLFGFLVSAADATPPVLDKVPTNAMIVIGVSNPDKLQKNFAALGEAINFPIPIPAVDDLLAQMGAEKGVDKGKSIALVIMPPPNGGKNEKGEMLSSDELGEVMEQSMYILMPTTDYAAFIGNFEAKKDGAIDAGQIEGDDAFFKDLGNGYAAMSPSKDVMMSLDIKGGSKAAIDAALGANGVNVVDGSDLFVMVNLDEARVFQPMIMDQIEDQMEGNPAGLALGGVNDGPMGDIVKQLSEQAKTMVIGLRPDAMGVALDMAWAFKPESDLAKAFDGKGTTGSLMTKLPNQPYFFAMAMDMSTPGMKMVVDRMSKQMVEDGMGGLPAMLADQLKASDGAAFTVGSPQGGLMGGVLTSTVSYIRTAKPEGYTAAMQKGMGELNGQAMGPMKMASSYSADSGDVDGKKVDTYAVKFTPSDEDEADPQMGMAMQIIFGSAGGPGGYVAKVDGGVLQTYSKNSLLMGAAMRATAGGESLAGDRAMAQVAERLPKDRMMELFIGVRSILEAALPLAAMGGVNVELDLPPNMPPVGVGLAGGKAGAQLGIFMPTPVIKTIMSAAQQAGGMMGGGDDDAAPAGRPRDNSQPRF